MRGMKMYKIDLEVDVHDVDYNGVARFSSLMKYIQTAAQSQLTSIGLSYDQMKEKNRAFILSRIKIDFSEPLRAYDKITAVSYPCESHGYRFLRCYGLEKDGRLIGRAVSVWALIDIESRGLVKVEDFELDIELEEPNDLALTRFRLPSALSEVGTYTVNYGDTDQNGHMNNTRYPDMYSNFLPMDGRRIRTITINYLNEAPRGERLRVFMAKEGENLFYIKTVREDGKVNSEAEIIMEDI